MEIFKAHNQWSNRPADERFWSLADMAKACESYKVKAVTKKISYPDLRVEAVDTEVQLVGRAGVPARLSHWAFGQLAARVTAPAGYLRRLPATLAAQNLNHGLKEAASDDKEGSALFHPNGSWLLRSINGQKYGRIWNSDICKYLLDLGHEWVTPPARPACEDPRAREATQADVDRCGGRTNIQVGDKIAPAGCYASDEDMFVFLMNPNVTLDDGSDTGLCRGFIVSNSEVGKAPFSVMAFDYKFSCGNHIIWGAENVSEINVRHIGDAHGRAFTQLRMDLVKYASKSVSDRQAIIDRARTMEIGSNTEEVVKAALAFAAKKKVALLNKPTVQAIVKHAEEPASIEAYGSPRSVWALVNAATELSQRRKNMDDRVDLDRAASRLMELAYF